MGHMLTICVSKEPPSNGIVGYRRITVREKLFRFLLGSKRRLTVIIPGDSVNSLSIIEEGDKDHEQSAAAFECSI